MPHQTPPECTPVQNWPLTPDHLDERLALSEAVVLLDVYGSSELLRASEL